jgi:hypothetical protein
MMRWRFASSLLMPMFHRGQRTAPSFPSLAPMMSLQEAVPDDVSCERGWRGLRVCGPLAFSLVGVLAGLLSPLAEAGIRVFVLSTFDTDYVLVKEETLEQAIQALEMAGHRIERIG